MATAYTYHDINLPGGATNPSANDINALGVIIGGYPAMFEGGSSNNGAFVDTRGSFTTFQKFGTDYNLNSINIWGEAVGWTNDETGTHGLVYWNGKTSQLDVPKAFGTILRGVNNIGQIVGSYFDASGNEIQFEYTAGRFVPLNLPGEPFGINDTGSIVGNGYDDAGLVHGYLYKNSHTTTIQYPGSENTFVADINDKGDIVGWFSDSLGIHGFLYSGGQYQKVDAPNSYSQGSGSYFTELAGIDNLGNVAGTYNDGSFYHAFYANPSPASAPTYSSLVAEAASTPGAAPDLLPSLPGNTSLAPTTTGVAAPAASGFVDLTTSETYSLPILGT